MPSVRLQAAEALDPQGIESAFATMTRERAGALVVLPDAIFGNQRKQIADLAAKSRLPSICGIPEYGEAGGLIVYSANNLELGRRAAIFVDRILKGARPADLPVEQPTKFELVINLKNREGDRADDPAIALAARGSDH